MHYSQGLQHEIETDRLRMAGYRSNVERRRRDVRTVVGNALIAAGERVRGYRQMAPRRA